MRAYKLLSLVFTFLFSFLIVGCSLFKKEEVTVPDELIERPDVDFTIPYNNIKKVELENGFKVIVFKRDQYPKVLVQIAYNVGSGQELSGERGLAHLIEHMIFKGTKKLSESDITAIARKYGAMLNAFTSKDVTSYFFESDKNNWESFVEIMADCMLNARFESEHLASELKAVIQEKKMYEDDYWHFLSDKACELLVPANHPYHHPILGFKEDLFSFSSEKLRKFYNKYYGPNNATLFIVGDVNIDDAIAIARKSFGNIPRKELPEKRIIPQYEVDTENQSVKIYRDVKKERIGFFWKIPGLKSNNNVLVSIVESILSGGEGSLLYKRLVDKDKIAIDLAAYGSQRIEAGAFFILIAPKDGCYEKCKIAVCEELNKIIKNGVSLKNLKKSARLVEKGFLNGLQRNTTLTNYWINSFFSTGDEFELFKRVKAFNQVTVKDVQSFVFKNLDPFFMNEIRLLPIPEERKQLWLENKKRSEEVDSKILKKFVRTTDVEEKSFANLIEAPKKLEFNFPEPTRLFELPNGLKVLLHKSGDLPLIHTDINFKDSSFISSSLEGREVSCMMGMLIEGSEKFKKSNNVDFFEMYGAGYSFNSSGASLSTVNVAYKPVLERFFYVLTRPEFNKNNFEKVRSIFIDSYLRAKESPVSVAKNIMNTLIYKNHPFGWSIDEAIETIKNVSISNLKSIHKKYIAPNNMSMVVVGNFNLDEMEENIREVMSEWNRGQSLDFSKFYNNKSYFEQSNFEPDKIINYEMLRDQVAVLMGRDSDINIYHKDYYLLKLLNYTCFNFIGSRLYNLRERSGLFYNAGGGIGVNATKVKGLDFVFARVSKDRVKEAQESIKELIDNFGDGGITAEELEDARQAIRMSLISMVTTIESMAGSFGSLEEFGFDYDYYNKKLEEIQSVTLDEINSLCKKRFNSKRFSTIKVGRA